MRLFWEWIRTFLVPDGWYPQGLCGVGGVGARACCVEASPLEGNRLHLQRETRTDHIVEIWRVCFRLLDSHLAVVENANNAKLSC